MTPDAMLCCPQCFGDHHLADEVFPNQGSDNGACDYCGAAGQHLLPPHVLRDLFLPVVGAYETSEDGSPLSELLLEDWSMFENASLSKTQAQQLVESILGDDMPNDQSYTAAEADRGDAADKWKLLRDELRYKNRFFPETRVDLARLGELLIYLQLPLGRLQGTWYRARIQSDETPFRATEMGAAPREKASSGRANPPGIPYLYLASDPDTAIAELRPHKGDCVSVAEFSLVNGLDIVDLAAPRRTVSPFVPEDEGEVARLREDIRFLEQLGAELSRPVLPKSIAVDYAPSQYLCEFIKTKEFDGVRYSSSVGDGFNLALFSEQKGLVGAVTAYEVRDVSFAAQPV
jgi:hypothetical protein